MSRIKDIVKLPTAITSHCSVNADSDTLSTMSMFTPRIVYSRALTPHSSIDVSAENLVRMFPLETPTYMRLKLVYRAFFVPYRTINNEFTNFIEQTINSYGAVAQKGPYFTNNGLWEWLLRMDAATVTYGSLESGTSAVYETDYAEIWITDGPQYYDMQLYHEPLGKYVYVVWKKLGRDILTLLNGLGYKFMPKYYTTDSQTYNLYPLLSAVKLWYDYYVSQQYSQDTEFYTCLAHMNRMINVTSTPFCLTFTTNPSTDATRPITGCLISMAKYANYGPSYFTSAFSLPTGPTAQQTLSIPNNNSGLPSVQATANTANDDAHITGITSSTKINQFALNALGKLTDYLKRHSIAGGRALDRYLSRWGITLAADKLNRSTYLGMGETTIQIGDIMSTAATDDASLGDYAGRGLGFGGNGHFHCSTDEFGHFIIVAQIIPTNIGYVDGIKRECLKRDYTEWFQPEFDGLGNQAISSSELVVDDTYRFQNTFNLCNSEDVFGYMSRYSEYQVPNDFILGDYNFKTMNSEYIAYSPFRHFGTIEGNYYATCVSSRAGNNFLRTLDASQFNRIFAGDTDADYFNAVFHFNVRLELPMKPLFEDYDFTEAGKAISMSVGGTNLNGADGK